MKNNFIEGMACKGGCVGGPACLSHNPRALAQLELHKKQGTASIGETVAKGDFSGESIMN